nr:His/Gly/Thr/Pro-type tRNA ligase C-terminal domain-containing protein [Staphylococcus equorum]
MRNAQIKKVPYTIVIDNDEVSNNTLSVRKYGEHEGQIYNVNEFIAIVMNENNILN